MNDQPPRDDAASPTGAGALTCFVIGPIGSRLADVGSPERETYEEALAVMAEVIEPACHQVGLVPVRADGLARAGEITEQIFRRLRDDDVVIADLTGANANVMYELGLRHTRGKLTVQIGEFGRLPFDVNTIRTIQFSRSAHGLVGARKDLVEILSAGIAGSFDHVTATKVWLETHVADLAAWPRTDEGSAGQSTESAELPKSASDDRGFLDILADGEAASEELTPELEKLNSHIVGLGELSESTTREVHRSDASGLGMRGRLQVATRYAHELGEIAPPLERDVDRFVTVLESVSAATLTLIAIFEQEPSQLADPASMEYATTIRSLARATRIAMASLADMVESIEANAQMSRVLREPSRKLTNALNRIADATSIVDEWDRRFQSLGVPMPPFEDGETEERPGAEKSDADPSGHEQ